MLNCFVKTPLNINNSLRDICTKSTNESIRKLTEKYNLERKKPQFKTLIYDDSGGDEVPNFVFLNFILFLSISSITFYFYRRLQ
jgi:hypothetical protein